jgi:hypothetical protein
MSDETGLVGLAQFIQDLRAELEQARAAADGQSLQLAVDEVELAVDVVYTATRSAETSAKIGAKFWVVASAEAGAKGALGSTQGSTQRITLKLKPRIDELTVDESGTESITTRSLEVQGAFAAREERPALPFEP